jgi:hypothetical protein
MSNTKQIPRAEWKSYFERFTRQHLGESQPETVSIEVISPSIGDQFETRTVELLGIDYDPKSETFEVLTEDVDHLAFFPTEIWVVEEEGGFISAVSLTRPDGSKEILHIQRGGPPAPRYDQPPA